MVLEYKEGMLFKNGILKWWLFIFMMFFIKFMYCQNIKEQIGTSVWLIGDSIIADSTIAHIYSYTKEGKLQKEWKVDRDLQGNLDTNYVVQDTLGRMIESYSGKKLYLTEYDDSGTIIKITTISTNDTTVINYLPEYDAVGKLNKVVQLYESENSAPVNISVRYSGDTIIKVTEDLLIEKRLYNAQGLEVYYEHKLTIPERDPVTEKRYWIRNEDGKVKIFRKLKNNNVAKETFHFYYNGGIETYQIEKFPEYEVHTTYRYTYW